MLIVCVKELCTAVDVMIFIFNVNPQYEYLIEALHSISGSLVQIES
jgi:hypothetical protein